MYITDQSCGNLRACGVQSGMTNTTTPRTHTLESFRKVIEATLYGKPKTIEQLPDYWGDSGNMIAFVATLDCSMFSITELNRLQDAMRSAWGNPSLSVVVSAHLDHDGHFAVLRLTVADVVF